MFYAAASQPNWMNVNVTSRSSNSRLLQKSGTAQKLPLRNLRLLESGWRGKGRRGKSVTLLSSKCRMMNVCGERNEIIMLSPLQTLGHHYLWLTRILFQNLKNSDTNDSNARTGSAQR